SARCAALIAEWSGGRVLPGALDFYPQPQRPRSLRVRAGAVRRLLGVSIPPPEMARLLRSIEIEAEERDDGVEARVPTFRVDVTREVDLIEELARLYGYERVPATIPAATRAPEPSGDPVVERARDALAECGLYEAMTYAFTSLERLRALDLPAGGPAPLPP